MAKEMKTRKSYKRGYPISLLIGFKPDGAVLWEIFSHVAKPQGTYKIEGDTRDQRVLYNFHESLIEALKPHFNEGVRSTILVVPSRTNYGKQFLEHIQKHHRYLFENISNGVTFSELEGSAVQPQEVAELARTAEFRVSVKNTTSAETEGIIRQLEKTIGKTEQSSLTLFSLKEIEATICGHETNREFDNRYLLLTDKYLATVPDKRRIQRLLQIANNKKVKTRIVNSDTTAGKRISQFGGLILFEPYTKGRKIRPN